MVTKIALEGVFAKGGIQEPFRGAPRHRFLRPFNATWSILDDFGDLEKSDEVAKTARKIQYGDF